MKFPTRFNVLNLNGTNGFMFIGNSGDYWFGRAAANLGDVNNDTNPDLLVSALSNQAYVLFGAKHFPPRMYTSSLNGTNGFMLIGESQIKEFGCLAGVGDINMDGINDFILGSRQIPQAFVFFGSDHFPPELHTSDINGTKGFEIVGPLNAGLGYSVAGIDNFNGDGKPATVVGTAPENTPCIQSAFRQITRCAASLWSCCRGNWVNLGKCYPRWSF